MPIPYRLNLDGDIRDHPGAGVQVKDHLRPAWRWAADGSVMVDIPAGREAVRDWLRQEREGEWPWVDGERAKATDTDDADRLALIRAYAAALRDAPAHASIADAATATALRAIMVATVAGSRP